MRFRVTLSIAFDADTGYDALMTRQRIHSFAEDAIVDHSIVDPDPDGRLEEQNLSHGMIEGLDEESSRALSEALREIDEAG